VTAGERTARPAPAAGGQGGSAAAEGADPGRGDLVATLLATVVFGFSLGVSMICLPLVAVTAGYSAAQIGVLTALAAIGQLATRLLLGPLMRRFTDRLIVQAGAVLLLASAVILIGSSALVVLAASQLCQGAARGFVWTATKTHVVRRRGPSLPRLATNSLVNSIGSLTGPFAGGIVAHQSLDLALALCAVTAAVTGLLTVGMSGWDAHLRAELADSAAKPPPAWRIPGIRLGGLTVLAAAGWTGLTNGLVAVLLHDAGQDARTIGLLLTVANAGAVVGGTVVFRLAPARMPLAAAGSAMVMAAGIAATCYSARWAAVGAVCLGLSGVGSGALQTLAYAIAADAVPPGRRSDAVVGIGLARAVALLIAPLGAGALAALVALPLAIAATAVGSAVPVLVAGRAGRRRAPPARATVMPDVPP
jgi:MFS family permease